jgi:hypothetical protein
MVQLYIRLLTGRFQVRILVAEPTELGISPFQTYRLRRMCLKDHQVAIR